MRPMNKGRSFAGRLGPIILGAVLGASLVFNLIVLSSAGSPADLERRLALLEKGVGKQVPYAADSNFREPVGSPDLWSRLKLVEQKVNGATNWVKDPHIWDEDTYKCKSNTNLAPPGTTAPGFYDHHVCMDNIDLKSEKCVVYDFGIRQQPHFGEALARDYGCEVHAFDPSPVTLRWIESSEVAKLPNYHFHPWGGGGFDGETTLYEYWDWDQVSIVKYPSRLTDEKTDGGNGKDYVNFAPGQKKIPIQVRTIPSIMKELGHESVTILKVDVEGSEFLMLEDLFDTVGCPAIDQLTLEWHHFDMDMRYGAPATINSVNSMLLECGHKQFQHMNPYKRKDEASQLEFRYSLASFCKRCHEGFTSVLGR